MESQDVADLGDLLGDGDGQLALRFMATHAQSLGRLLE
jgi:hypothetical protein